MSVAVPSWPVPSAVAHPLPPTAAQLFVWAATVSTDSALGYKPDEVAAWLGLDRRTLRDLENLLVRRGLFVLVRRDRWRRTIRLPLVAAGSRSVQ